MLFDDGLNRWKGEEYRDQTGFRQFFSTQYPSLQPLMTTGLFFAEIVKLQASHSSIYGQNGSYSKKIRINM